METFGNKKSPKIPKKYDCVFCMYSTCNLKDYKKHTKIIKKIAKNVIIDKLAKNM